MELSRRDLTLSLGAIWAAVAVPGEVLAQGLTWKPTALSADQARTLVIDGKLITQHCTNSAFVATPNGEWVTFEVEVLPSGQVTHIVNGERVLTYSGVQLDPTGNMANSKPLIASAGGKLELTSGYIALQSEGAPIEFRKIEIQELR